jgi:hypothetical protein
MVKRETVSYLATRLPARGCDRYLVRVLPIDASTVRFKHLHKILFEGPGEDLTPKGEEFGTK